MDQPLKLRIMCSYGGHIIPRPRTKSLCYAGGETRIVSLNATSIASLSSLVSHLSSSLSISTPFSLKYQLPNHDLDSLISLLTDDDLLILLEELQRLNSSSGSSSSSSQSRIRLFFFPAKLAAPETEDEEEQKSVLSPPPPSSVPEAWFFDSLKSTKIMQKGRNCGGLGFEGETGVGLGGEDLAGNGNGVGSISVAESMMLETSSSFGSTSSSASLANLAPVRSNVDDTGIGLQDSIVKLTPSDTISSEYGGSAAASNPQSGAYKDPSNPIYVTSMDTKVSTKPPDLEIRGSDVTSGIQIHNTVMASPYQLDPMQQQKVQYIQVESPYMSQNPPGMVPMSSFYPVYHTQLPQQQMVQYQYYPNQPQPMYLLPVAPTQTYSFTGYPGFVENSAISSTQSPLHMNASYIAPQVVQTEPMQADALPNLGSQVYNTPHSAIPVAAAPIYHAPQTESQQQPLGLCEKPQQIQSVTIAYREPSKDSTELHDDPARLQIYKSQPPPPACTSQYQTMTKTTEMLLSEALDQLHTDSLKQQVRTSQPQ